MRKVKMFKWIKRLFERNKSDVNKKILIIESDVANYSFLRGMLNKDFCTFVGKDRDEGYQMAAKIQPDLIILGCRLCGEKTVEYCGQLKHESETKNIPILIIAENKDDSNVAEYYLQRIDGYLVKPVVGKELAKQIKFLIKEKETLGIVGGIMNNIEKDKGSNGKDFDRR